MCVCTRTYTSVCCHRRVTWKSEQLKCCDKLTKLDAENLSGQRYTIETTEPSLTPRLHVYVCIPSSQDVVKGNQRLNLAYVAHLFNTYPALKPVEEGLDDFDLGNFEETREEKSK